MPTGRAPISAPCISSAFLAGQFGVFGPVLMAAWLVGLWRLVRGDKRREPGSCPRRVQRRAACAHHRRSPSLRTPTPIGPRPPMSPPCRSRWPKSWTAGRAMALLGSFALHGAVWCSVVILCAAGCRGRGSVSAMSSSARKAGGDLADAVSARIQHAAATTWSPPTTAASPPSSSTICVPRGPPVRIWDPDIGKPQSFRDDDAADDARAAHVLARRGAGGRSRRCCRLSNRRRVATRDRRPSADGMCGSCASTMRISIAVPHAPRDAERIVLRVREKCQRAPEPAFACNGEKLRESSEVRGTRFVSRCIRRSPSRETRHARAACPRLYLHELQ